MPTIKKKTPKKKKQTEVEFKSIMHYISDFYHDYKKQFDIALAAVAVILVIGIVYTAVQSGKEKKAGQLLSAALEHYSPAGGASANYQKALEGFQELRTRYGGTLSGAVAQYYVGNTLVNLGRFDEALKEYEAFEKKYSADKALSGLVYQRTGYVYLTLGRQDDAVKAFEKSEKQLGTGTATVELARLYERAGNAAEAQKKYKEIAEKLSGTQWAMEARTKLLPPELTPSPKPAATGTAPKNK